MNRPPIRPHLRTDEAPVSFLGRCARASQWPIDRVIDPQVWQRMLRSRRVDRGALERLTQLSGASPEAVLSGTLQRYHPEVVGEISPGYATAMPLGWALTQWSTRCPACQEQGEPWPVQQQTGLAFGCPHHRRYLRSACAACAPRRSMFVHGDYTCRHHPGPDDEALAPYLVDLQEDLFARLDESRSHPENAEWLLTLRATTVLVWVDAALTSRSPYIDATLRVLARRRLLATTKTGHRRSAARLDRPVAEPWVNARLIDAAVRHLDAAGHLDLPWAQAVAADAHQVPSLPERMACHLGYLGLWSATAPRPEIHRDWLLEAQRCAAQWQAAGRGVPNVPAALRTASESISTPWAMSLARATVLVCALAEHSTTGAVLALGHHFTHVTSVRQILTRPPARTEIHELREAVTHHLQEPAVDYAARRVRAGRLQRVDAAILSHLRLGPPHTRSIDPQTAAAVWLWLARTEGHPIAVPFVDGRILRPLLDELETWARQAPAENLLALLAWADDYDTDQQDAQTTRPYRPQRSQQPLRLRGA